jgi:PAS domain S-box-containing protein
VKADKPTYEELEQRVKELEKEAAERKSAEVALRESEERLQIVLDTIQAGIVVIDPEAHVIVGVNAAAGKMVGASMKLILGSGCHKYICPAGKGQCPITDLRQDFENTESVLLTADGKEVPILKTVVPVILAGRQHLLESFVDIAERKQAEEELEKANEELKSFVHVVSHDLKNPIMSIQGFSHLLRRKCQEALGEKGRSYVDQIETSAHRMEVLVSDLVNLSRVGRLVATFKDVSSLGIVRKVTSHLQDRLKQSRIQLTVADNFPIAHCDEERIYQVFENLVVNSIKFMGDTEERKIQIGYEDTADLHQFYVRDSGIGIDPKHHRKIFGIFDRLNEVEDNEGTGLGLSIVEKIVKKHGGKVWVKSEKGKGATFYFSLPKVPCVDQEVTA